MAWVPVRAEARRTRKRYRKLTPFFLLHLTIPILDGIIQHAWKIIEPSTGGQAQARKATAGRASGGGNRGASSNILQFYTDDSPGLQVSPTQVLVASLSFVGVVVVLHILGKFRSQIVDEPYAKPRTADEISLIRITYSDLLSNANKLIRKGFSVAGFPT
ncbi:hypothetical protein THAOC_05119 [Thalassiosira oceanica]|uniref:Protein transport protein Sec61 subunit beta n=1 Tax=Thalassiosira oceanica TaxID=159749 RepID=K0THU2_THAOC|nr:hypothetical protein THAOC_05119 [Thalassiosira oceanica]|eukprot:EJK73266.1 hypothetical protein THAOC_05119 [Thalassiosira oceanica]